MMSAPRVIEVATVVLNDPNEPTVTDVETSNRMYQWLRTYFSKWTGQHMNLSSSTTLSECIVTFFGTFIGVAILGAVHYRLLINYTLTLFIASFGASAVLVYGLPLSPLSQPRSVIGGQVISAIVGCAVRLLFGSRGETFVAVAISVSVTVLLMQLSNTMHAPAGATAVIAITTSPGFPWAGFQFVLMPVLSSSIILIFVGIVINNLVSNRHYPCYWW